MYMTNVTTYNVFVRRLKQKCVFHRFFFLSFKIAVDNLEAVIMIVINSDSVHMQCCFFMLLKYMIGDWLCLLSNPELSTKRLSNQYTLL